MKKLLAASVMTLALVAGLQQPASAWSSCRFSIGMSLEWSKGNNDCLWGLYRSGPGPMPYGGGYGGGFAPAPMLYGAAPQADYYPAAPAAGPSWAPPAPQLANYPSYGPGYYPASYYQPSSYFQLANYPMSYPSSYYPMSYGYSYGFSFYGN
jgi:hypothetical protein